MSKEMVMIKWHDARFFSGTHDESEVLAFKMAIFESLGFLISQDSTTTVIASEYNNQDEYRDITLIPSGSIISVSKLTPSPSV